MGVVLGILFHFIGGFASGSFYVPFRRVKDWSWESAWIVGGVFSWLIVPFIAAALTVPDFMGIIQSTDAGTLFWTYFFGLLWGVGGLTFGLSMRYLGMSLGMSVALGYCSAFGALVPSMYYAINPEVGKTGIGEMFASSGGQLILFGVLVCLAGIAVCGRAGMLKERELDDATKKEGVAEFNLVKGLIVATISGILSACFNFGIEAGKDMAHVAVERGANPLFQNNVIFVVLLWGGLTTNFLWCMILNTRNKSFGDYGNKKSPLLSNYGWAAMAGTTWFLQFFFYGMGESKLGNGASSWILHMAFIILISSAWGLFLKEWKGVSRRTITTVIVGIGVILLSVLLVGWGNSM
ncbi:MAG: L-rhamnose/proton symporter RhaT [Saprospiraceae bacterium]|nr:L-rhamnose/proton symporter RhaT [Saprospiraceae bacterium]